MGGTAAVFAVVAPVTPLVATAAAAADGPGMAAPPAAPLAVKAGETRREIITAVAGSHRGVGLHREGPRVVL